MNIFDILKTESFRKSITRIVLIFIIPSTNFRILEAQELEMGGFVEIDHISYAKNSDDRKINSRNQGILQMELRSNLGDEASLFSAVEFREDQSDPSKNRIYLDEAYLDFYIGNFDFRLGKQIILWGQADAINPTDNITPWDFTDFLDTEDERIGVVALEANYYVGDWSLEGILVPTFTPSTLPTENSRWFPNFAEEISNAGNTTPGSSTLKASYRMLKPILPDESVRHAQFATKLSATLSGWDVSVSYYSGRNDLPVFHQTQSLSRDTLLITLQPQYHRRKIIGADFSTTLGKVGLRGEGAYYFTEDPDGKDPEIDDPYFQYVIGLDRTFGNLMGENDLSVLIQWIQEIPKNSTSRRKDDLNHIFQKSITARFEYELGEFSRLTMEAAYNIKGNDYYLRPKFSHDITDGVSLHIIGYILGGNSDTFFGSFRDNKRAQVRVKYSF